MTVISKRGAKWKVATSSNDSTNDPVPSTSIVTPRKPRRKSLNKSQWEALKHPILELYRTHKLNHLMAIMKKEYLFDATEQMYKKKLSAWHGNIGGQKNIFYTKAQKKHMIKRYLTRKLLGKKTCFEMRTMGKLNALQTKKLQRALQRALEDPDSIGVSGLVERFQQIQLERSSLCGLIRHASTCSTQGAGGLSRSHSITSQRSSVYVNIPSCRLKRFCSTNSRASSCRDSIIDYTPPGSGTCSRSISLRLAGTTPEVLSNADDVTNESTKSEDVKSQRLTRRPAVRMKLAKKLPRVKQLQKAAAVNSDRTFSFNTAVNHENEIEEYLKTKYKTSFDVYIDSERSVENEGIPTAKIRVVCNDCSGQRDKYKFYKIVEIIIGTGSMSNMIGIKSIDIDNIALELASHLGDAIHSGSENRQSDSFEYLIQQPQTPSKEPQVLHDHRSYALNGPQVSPLESSMDALFEGIPSLTSAENSITQPMIQQPITYPKDLMEWAQLDTTNASQALVPYPSSPPHHTHRAWSQDAFFAAPSLFSPSTFSPSVTHQASNDVNSSVGITSPPQLSLIVPSKPNLSSKISTTSWFDDPPELVKASNESSPSTKSPDDLFNAAWNNSLTQAMDTSPHPAFYKTTEGSFDNNLDFPIQWGPTSLEPTQIYLSEEPLWQPPLNTGSIIGNDVLMSSMPTDSRRAGRYFSSSDNIVEQIDSNSTARGPKVSVMLDGEYTQEW